MPEWSLCAFTRISSRSDIYRSVTSAGVIFVDEDEVDGDHVPPRAAFNARDKEPPLKLKTHVACNSALKVDDKKIGQLIALRRREGPTSPRDQALEIVHYRNLNMAAVENS